MRIIENDAPTPRLLTSAAAEISLATHAAGQCSGRLQRNGEWVGNAFAMFAGIALGALLLCAAGTFMLKRNTALESEASSVRLIAVGPADRAGTGQRAGETEPSMAEKTRSSGPASVQLTPELFRVTAISLGHPRLAVINRQQVAEGDWIEVTTPAGRIGIKLHVIRIADGGVELLVGDHVLNVPMQRMKLKPL